MTDAAFETPSGKGAGGENFPVGSFLLPRDLRPHVMAFYRFVRAADDIADHPDLAPKDKLGRLERFRRALDGTAGGDDFEKARALRKSLARTGVSAEHAHDLLRAFMQDATKSRYRDWADLLSYCRLSASPVGRFLLDLHGEERALWRFSDPLCDALQILNHLQDCQADYRRLGRVYLPLDAFEAAGSSVEALGQPAADPPLRRVLEDVLNRTAGLLERAAPLPRALGSPRLAAESAVILAMARRLLRMLERRDPLAERVELGRLGFALVAMRGVGAVLFDRLLPGRAGRSSPAAS